MARVKPDGTFSGRIGNIVYYTRNGKTFTKEYKAPKDKKSLKQLIQRAKMGSASSFLSDFRQIIEIGYQGPEVRSTGYQEALEYHMKYALNDITPKGSSDPVLEVDLEKLKLSRGILDAPVIESCSREGNILTLNWDPTLGDVINRLFDSLVLVAYNRDNGVHAVYHLGSREDGQGTTILPPKFKGPVHIWVFYLNQQKNQLKTKENVSDPRYVGEF